MPNLVYASTDEALNKIMQIIGEAYTLAGADTEILDRLQDVIVVHFQNKAKEMGQQAANMAMKEVAPGMGMGVGPGPALPPRQMGPGGGGGMVGMTPNPDELRRVLGATGQVR